MKTIMIKLADNTTLPFANSDEQFARELRLAAAILSLEDSKQDSWPC